MAKAKIALDIDDVTADSTESLRLLVNERMGVSLTREDYLVSSGHADYYEYVWEKNGLKDINYAAFEAEMEVDQSHVPLMDGVKEAMVTLSKTYDIVFITARDVAWEKATREWFARHFDGDVELYFSEGYTNVGRMTKGQICKAVGAQWLIDDVPKHCQSALDEGVRAILFGTYGWHGDVPEGVIRCKDWQEVKKVLEA